MGPPSSGGSTVGEALNILEGYPMSTLLPATKRSITTSKPRDTRSPTGAYLGDPAYVDVPLKGLLSKDFAAESDGRSSTDRGRAEPGRTGEPLSLQRRRGSNGSYKASQRPSEGPSTTHLTVSDKWGNIVSYTFTIEQTGGSAITVPDHGFILNNELTDFEPVPGLANSPAGGKRPRSSMSPTIVTDQQRKPDTRARFSRRVDDHHDRAASTRQRPGLRHDPT